MGSGKDYRSPDDGWTNLEKNRMFKADIYMDIMEYDPLDHYSSGSFEGYDEILAKDVIDHVTYADARKLLPRLYSWLRNNGLLFIHTPNFEFCAKKAIAGDHEAMTWLYGSDGTKSNYETNFIKWGYTPKSLRKLLEKTGFMVLNVEHTCDGYGFQIIAIKRE